MRIFITKQRPRFITIVKESTIQSILVDLFTILVVVIVFGVNALYQVYIGPSLLFNIFSIVVLLWLGYSLVMRKKKKVTKEELHKLINELYDEDTFRN